MNSSAGYSGTPLWKKLGYADGLRAFLIDAPAGYVSLLRLPPEIKVAWQARAPAGVRFVHLFATEASVLRRHLTRLRTGIAPEGVIWVSWPKKASGVATDITEDTIRSIALPTGLVDIKVCAVDDTWSGLKLMIRKSER